MSRVQLATGASVGAYRLVRQIGAGGMGAVWLAEHAMLGRRAAIKLLHAEYSCRPEIVARFFNEAKAATTIADPGIVQVFDFGQHAEGTAYIVMELLDGETLDERRRRPGGLQLADALRILRQVAMSLSAAHACGIVHRDLKPENIFLVRDPEVAGGERPKILDFGIAKLTDGSATTKTHTAAVMGTPTYMAPEQCRGAGRVDHRADIYALGCVLFTLIAGRPPFEAEGVGELMVAHLTEPAPRLASLVLAVPAALDALVARCLEKDPARRFASAAALATALGGVAAGSTLADGLREPPNTSVPVPTTLSGSAVEVSTVSPPAARRARRVIASVAAFGLALAAIGLVGAAREGSSEPSASPRAATGTTEHPAPPPATTGSPPPPATGSASPHGEATSSSNISETSLTKEKPRAKPQDTVAPRSGGGTGTKHNRVADPPTAPAKPTEDAQTDGSKTPPQTNGSDATQPQPSPTPPPEDCVPLPSGLPGCR